MIGKDTFLRAGYLTCVALVAAYLTGIAAYFLLRLLIGDRHWTISFLNNVSIYVILPLIFCFPIALALRLKPLWISSLALLLISTIWLSPYFLPHRRAGSSGSQIKIVTFNIWGGNTEQNQVANWIQQTNADIVFLQEVPDSFTNNVLPLLRDHYAYQYRQETEQHWWSNAVLSKYPLETITDLDPENDIWSTRQRLVVHIFDSQIALYSIHLTYTTQHARISTSSPLLSAVTRYDDTDRNLELDHLVAEIQKESLPFIVAGDFNMSAQAVSYNKLVKVMNDSFLEAGYGLGGTWPVSDVASFPSMIPPLMRIDYIWHSQHFQAIEAIVGPRLGSDHLPIYTVLEIVQ